MARLTAPPDIRGRIQGDGRMERLAKRLAFVKKAVEAGHGPVDIAAALELRPSHVRDMWRGTFARAAAPKPVVEKAPRAMILAGGQVVSVAALPWDIGTDPRRETAPRHRGLIGGRVERDVDHTDAILARIGAARGEVHG